MDFFDAMEMLKDGEKVRIKSWPKDRFLGIQEQEVKICGKIKTKFILLDESEQIFEYIMSLNSLIGADWEEFGD